MSGRLLVLTLLILASSIAAGENDADSSQSMVDSIETADSVDDTGVIWVPDNFFGSWGLVEYTKSDVARMLRIMPITLDFPISGTPLAYEWHFAFISSVKKDTLDTKGRLASTALVMSLAITPVMWTSAIFGRERFAEQYLVPILAAPFGSHLALVPADWLQIYAGVIPEIVLFTTDNGILWQGRIGIRVNTQIGLLITIEAVHDVYDPFSGAARDGRWGFGIGIHPDPKKIQMLR